MAFPQDRLPIKQELLINGVWTDITSRTRESAQVQITRGYSSEQASLSAAQCAFVLNNRDGLFSNRNPTSAYYKQIGRNTQYRTSVTETTPWFGLRDYSVVSTGIYDLAAASTADKAVLDVVGDLDVRIDVEPDNWRVNNGYILAGKYARTSNQRSWCLYTTRTGFLVLTWSPDGTSTNRKTATSTAQVPALGRIVLRAVLDVDNGAGGYTVTFYTAPTIGGTYTALGTAVTVTAGITSIFSGSALLEVGSIDNAGRGDVFSDVYPYVGRIYGFQMRNGIAGTLVANFDPTSRTPGDIAWSDGLTTPNTWQVNNSDAITNSDFRFWGEISKLPQRWDTSGQDVWVPVQASDLITRLSQGTKALESPVFRNLIQSAPDGYWPLETGSLNGSAFSSYAGKAAQLVSGNFQTDLTFPGTAGVLTFADDTGYASATTAVGAQTGVTYALFYFKLPSIPLADQPIINWYHSGGNVYRVTVVVTSIGYTINIIDSIGLSEYTESSSYGAGASPTGWVAMRIKLTTVSLTTTVDWQWYGVNNSVIYTGSGASFSGTTGRITSWISFPYTGKQGTSIAHVLAARKDVGFNTAGFVGSTNGYNGETVGARATRLSKEELVPFWLVGNFGDGFNEAMGVQTTSTYLDLLGECASLAGALIYTPRDKFGIAMRLPGALRNQASTTLSYSSKHLSGSLEPEEDDSLIRNDVTINKPNGGFGHVVKLAGALNANDPTTGADAVGRYDTSITLNAKTDDRLTKLAQREVFLGTWDELRYARVQVDLERAPFVASASLTRSVRALDLGDPFTITGLPKWLPPDDVELLVIGYTEVLKNRGWEIVWNTRPYGPYRVNDLTSSANSRFRVAASNSTVATAMNTTVGTMSVATASGALWSTSAAKPGNFPMNVTVAGEVMTVTAITGTTSPQTFTVTRSANGVVKSHATTETVQVVDRFYVAM